MDSTPTRSHDGGGVMLDRLVTRLLEVAAVTSLLCWAGVAAYIAATTEVAS